MSEFVEVAWALRGVLAFVGVITVVALALAIEKKENDQ